MIKHQDVFDALKEALNTAPIWGYPDFFREFILETDASLNGLGAVLSQQDKDRETHVIAYAVNSLCPSQRSMHHYSSAKLELLALMWAIAKKFQDYLLGSQFQVYMDNNPLTYIPESKLGASQIQWLSKLALFDFVIKYQTGHSNRATDALSHHPFNPSCDDSTIEILADSDEVKVISYSSVCEAVDLCLNNTKIPEDLRQEAQNISCAMQPINEEGDKDEIVRNLNAVSIFEQVTTEKMVEKQQKDPTLNNHMFLTNNLKHKENFVPTWWGARPHLLQSGQAPQPFKPPTLLDLPSLISSLRAYLISAIGNQEIACLVLLDLSAVFDMVDTGILLQRLTNRFGITGTVKTWIASYLTNQSQKVKIGSSESSSMTLECGVPQGSVLGPILFILDTTPLGQICRKHRIHYHLYADDSQLYMSFKPSKPGSKEACLHQLEGCISDIRLWMANNMLKLNDEKTKFIIFGTHQQLAKISDISINEN